MNFEVRLMLLVTITAPEFMVILCVGAVVDSHRLQHSCATELLLIFFSAVDLLYTLS